MARFQNNELALGATLFLAACLLFSGCRCAGFYSPVYSQEQARALLENNPQELTAFAIGWLKNHRDDSMTYRECHGEKLSFSRYARNGSGVESSPPDAPSRQETADLQQFAKRLRLEDVSVFRPSNQTQSWYVQFSLQGGAKCPYGLLYIPEDESLNMLRDADGGPGPGFSKLVQLQGRWFYFESR